MDLGLTDIELSLVQGLAFVLSFTVASLPIGSLVDRFSRRRVIFYGTVFWSLSAMASGIARTFLQLFAARAGVGAGEATLQPAAFSILSDLFPSGRLALPMSVFVIGANLGSGMSLILGAEVFTWIGHTGVISLPIIGQLAAWQLAFLFTGAPGLALAFVVFLIPRVGDNRPREHVGYPVQPTFSTMLRRYSEYAGFYVCHNFGFATCMAFVVGLLSWNPTFMSRHFGWGLGRIGLWLGGTQMVAAVLGLSFHGWAVDRLYRRGVQDAHMRYFVAMCPLAGVFAACAYLSNNPWTMIVLFNLSYFFLMGYPSVGAASLQITTPNVLRGKASAIYLIGLNIVGAALGPFIIAAITDYGFKRDAAIGYSMSIFAACTMIVGTITFALGSRHMRRLMARARPDSRARPLKF
jgi:MFS family permease